MRDPDLTNAFLNEESILYAGVVCMANYGIVASVVDIGMKLSAAGIILVYNIFRHIHECRMPSRVIAVVLLKSTMIFKWNLSPLIFYNRTKFITIFSK